MNRRSVLSSLLFSVILICSIFVSQSVFSRTSTDNFSISTGNLYFPGDEIKLNIYSYNYSDRKNKKSDDLKFNIEILKIKDVSSFYSGQSSRYNIDVLSKDSLNLTYLTESVYSFKKYFKYSKDYSYNSMNESLPININTKGAYLVKVTSGNKIAYCGFIVSSLGIISKAGNNSMLAFVVDRKTGAPVSNVDLNFFLGQNKIGNGKTSEGIYFQTLTNSGSIPENEDIIPMIIGNYNDDLVVSDPYLFFGNSGNKFYTYIYTEQPVYRTNSEVNFKGTIRRNGFSGLEPLSNQELTIIIKDSKGAEVSKQILRTNEMGSFNGTYKIEEEAPLGDYTIYANIDENNSYSSSFTVEQYKKPEYKVTVKTDKGQYFGKDILKAEIESKYFFGSPVADADVEYNIYKVRYYKPWWQFSEYAWWYEDYYENQNDNQRFNGAEMIYSGTGKLNSEGKFEIEYSVNEDFKQENYNNGWYRPYYMDFDYRYIVQAKVIDKSRREISGNTTALVTRGAFNLNAKVDKYIYKPGEKVNIEVMANDFSDKPVQTNFDASIYKTTWSRYDYKEKKDLVTSISGKTLSDGKVIISYNIGDGVVEGAYSVDIKAVDDRANQIMTSSYFYVSKGDMWWYYNQAGGVQIIPDKDSYKPGEVCKALIILANPDATVLVTTNSDDIISYSVEKFTGTSKIIEIPITDKYMSNFEINVNYIYDGTFVNSGKNVLVIPEEKFLTVQIDPSKLIYKPGEEGEVKVKVVDSYGNAVSNAEISIGIVDESIYSIKEDNTKDIRKFFYGNRNVNVSTAYNSNNSSNGNSRLITIYERFNLKSLSDKNLATVKGRLLRKNGNPIGNAVIVINEDYFAATTDFDGNFEFKLPEGDYTVGAFYNERTKDDLVEIKLYKGQIKTITLYNDKDMNEFIYSEQTGMVSDDSRSGRTNAITTDELKLSAPEKKMKGEKDGDLSKSDFKEAEIRSDFRDAIFWSPYVVTDAYGYATVIVKYPDNLTSWRITSRVITEDTKVGQMTSTVITRKDLIIRMETPRFLQEKDEVTISTIIHNYLSAEKKTKIKFSGENISIEDNSEKNIVISPDTDVRIDWKIKVTEPLGEAKLYAEALTNEESDAVEVKVPLQPKGLKVDANTIADFSDEFKTETKTVNIPDGTDMRSTGMKLSIDPSLASTVLTALDELIGYPYGCVEQTMSRFLPTVVVANTFSELNVPLSDATKSELPKMVNKGLQRLYSFQHSDGGWGWWENDNSNPYMTAYVIYGFSLSKKAGYEINESAFKNGINAMKSQLNNADPKLDATTKAYMLYSLAVAGEKNEELNKKVIENLNPSEVNDYARSLIAMTYKLSGDESKALEELTKLESSMKSTGEGAAYWEGKEFHYRWQDDKVQTTAMALKAIVLIKNNSDLKDKIIRWLMMQRAGTAWRNTQETALVIYAITDYLKYSSELEPDYSVKIYVNGKIEAEKNITKEDVYKKSNFIKIDNSVMKPGQNEIKIEKSGKGKVYFSSYTTYYLSQENIYSQETGFRVEREYFKLEKYNSYTEDKITYRKKYFDGNVKSGDDILVKLKVYSKEENQYFMLEDPLPSGIEVIKDDWSFTIEDENNYKGYPYYYWRWWYADKEIRDNRVTFFSTYIGKGEYEFSYIMRAQIPGDYSVNPSKAMLMYYPEYNGNTDNFKFTVTD